MASSVIQKPSWTLRDTMVFTSLTQTQQSVTIPKGSYSEILVVGGNMTADIPIIDGITNYQSNSYNNYANYGMRLQLTIANFTDSGFTWTVRLEEKLNNTGYPTLNLYTR